MSDIRVGDDVRVVSGIHEGTSGRVVKIATPDDVLFADSKRPLAGSFLKEDMALIQHRQTNAFNEVSVEEVAVPVRRLERRR